MRKLLYTLLLILPVVMFTSMSNADAKGGKNPERWLAKETADINEDFDEAIYKVDNSTLSKEAKELLTAQAKSNKELALKQAKETSMQKEKNWKAREKFSKEIKAEKKNRKAVKEVEEIL